MAQTQPIKTEDSLFLVLDSLLYSLAGVARVMIPELPPEVRAKIKYDSDEAVLKVGNKPLKRLYRFIANTPR
jgi:hypothetical protein